MRVIYNTCYTNPWLDVAQKLHDQHGWEPVYWNGYHDDDSRRLVPETFPDCIYHPYHAGWKGIFPEPIRKRYHLGALDVDFLKAIAPDELLALRMMDRMDADRYSFNTMERQRHFRNILRNWNAAVDFLEPDAVVSAIVPHRVFDYALYLICKYRGIPYLTFRNTSFYGRFVAVDSAQFLGDRINQLYDELSESDKSIEDLSSELPTDIAAYYTQVQQDYSKAEPVYMKKHVSSHRSSSGVLGLTKKLAKDMRESQELYFGEEGFIKKGMSYLKVRDVAPEDSKMSLVQYARLKLKNNEYKKKLKEHYGALVSEPNWDEPFVLLNLHYQPEMTSNPTGDVFADQMLCIDVLSRSLPEDWEIYVKEHRSQLYAHTEGHTARLKSFYDDLVKFPQVKLLPLNTDPFEAIKKAQAVCTITGTTGGEAMVWGKPVIIFGQAWYEQFNGVLRISDEASVRRIPEFIKNFKYDERDLLCYLNAFGKKSIRASTQRNHVGNIPEDRETSTRVLTEELIRMYRDAQAAD